MEFIQPKVNYNNKIKLDLSNDVVEIIRHYSEYTGFEQNEVVDMFLRNILLDENFLQWAKKRRFNQKIEKIITSNAKAKEIYDQLPRNEVNSHETKEESC